MSNVEKNDHPEDIIRRMKETNQKGKFGVDYTLCKRKKNEYQKHEYNINDDKINEKMMDLEPKDFIKKEKSNNLMHPEDIIYVFKKSVILMPKWIEDAEYRNVMIYIKITWPDEQNFMFIISFHQDNI